MIQHKAVRLVSAAVMFGGLGVALVPTSAAWAAGGTAHNITVTFEFGPNSFQAFDPFSLNPPIEQPFDLSSCPFDDATTVTVTGNAESHSTSAPSGGDWGGETINGATVFSDGALEWTGQATGWGGGGNNHGGQIELGETMHFHGVSTSDGSTLDVNLSYHGTFNNAGTPTNWNESITCRVG